ncbi:enoyl-CoA hydratase/isomerase family protein, partial [bacterium]|nr:enoyl-CoA hydratase/isomerase family protein [bacterium]
MKNLVLTKIEDAVGTLTLNNPEQYNSLTPEFLEMIQTGFNELIEDRSSKVIVLKAEGKVFSTGGNVKGFYDNLPRIKEYSMETVGLLNQVILLMIKSPLPIIAVVHGMVTGGSLGFVLASDLILITPQTTFTPYYSVVGYSPDGGWTALLPSIIGRKRAAEIMMLNKTITAEQSVLWGIANQIVEKDKINDEA